MTRIRPRKSRTSIPTGRGSFMYRKAGKDWPIDDPNVPPDATIYYRKTIEDPDHKGKLIRKTYCCWTSDPAVAHFLVDHMKLDDLAMDNHELFLRSLVKMGQKAAADLDGHLFKKPAAAKTRKTHTIVSRAALQTAMTALANHQDKTVIAACHEFRRALMPEHNPRKRDV